MYEIGDWIRNPSSLSVGDFIRKTRLNLGLTQKIVSDLAGYERSYLSHVECNDVIPSKEFTINILDALLKWEI